jgi:hypothetical protein
MHPFLYRETNLEVAAIYECNANSPSTYTVVTRDLTQLSLSPLKQMRFQVPRLSGASRRDIQ